MSRTVVGQNTVYVEFIVVEAIYAGHELFTTKLALNRDFL